MFKFNKFILVFASLLFTADAVAQTHSLAAGWNLVGNDAGTDVIPLTIFGDATTPTSVSASITTIWTWDNLNSRWNFYAPSMTASALSTYANSKGYGVLSNIVKGEGFWVNSNSAVIVNLTQASSTIRYAITWHEVSGNCTLYADKTFVGVLTPSGQANIYATVWYAGGAAITLTVPGGNAFDYSYAEGGGTATDHTQLTFDSQSRSITGSSNWTHTNGCMGYGTFSGFW